MKLLHKKRTTSHVSKDSFISYHESDSRKLPTYETDIPRKNSFLLFNKKKKKKKKKKGGGKSQ